MIFRYVVAPAGLFVARYFKDKMGPWWFKTHMGLMLVGVTGLTGFSFTFAYDAVQAHSHHFNFSNSYGNTRGMHIVRE